VFINLFSLKKFAGRFQVVVTVCKLGVTSIIICTGLYFVIFKGEKLLIGDIVDKDGY